jgi:hypothetical protein
MMVALTLMVARNPSFWGRNFDRNFKCLPTVNFLKKMAVNDGRLAPIKSRQIFQNFNRGKLDFLWESLIARGVACHAAPAPETKVAHKYFFPNLADVARETKVKSALSESRDTLKIQSFLHTTSISRKKITSGGYFLPAALSTFRHEKECLDENRPFLATLSVRVT